jgi:outer membrane cobalamin receptor
MQNGFIKRNLCLLGLFVSLAIQSQEDTIRTHQLQDVVVTERARPSVTRQSAPLQVINRSGIERLGIQELTEAIRHFSGVAVKDYGGIGGIKTISVRNLGTHHTGISYDGIAVNDCQSGQVDLGRFSLDNVESLSLTIGQTDLIFQTARMFASAGALHIQTATPVFNEKPHHTSVKLKAGSFGLFAPSIRHEQRLTNHLSTSLHADWLSAKGDYPFTLTNIETITHEKRRNSDIQSFRLEGNIFGEWSSNRRLTAKIYHYNSERGLPGSIILYNDYARERLWDKNTFVQAQYRKTSGEVFHWQALAKFNHAWNKYVDVNNKYATGQQEDRHLQREYYGSASAIYFPAERWSLSLNTDFFVNTLHNNIPECPFPVRYTTLSALAVQHKRDRLTVTGSVLGTYMAEHVETGDNPDDRKRFSPAISGSWLIFPEQNLRFRASYKDIYRAPTFNDLYYLRVGNKNLRPERATQYNTGFTWSGSLSNVLRYINISVDGYHNRIHDKIAAIPTLYIWKMMNLGEVSLYGLDVNLHTEATLPSRIKLFFQAAYSLQKAIDITDEAAKNYKHQIPYTPRHSGSASFAVDNPWLNVAYTLTAVDKRYALPENIRNNEIKGYIEQTVSVFREFLFVGRPIRFQAEVINIDNVQYDVIKFYPMPGRSFRMSITINI